MLKNFIFFLLLSISCAFDVAMADDVSSCPEEQLLLTRQMDSFPDKKTQTVHVIGTFPTPNPGYVYDIKIEKLSEDNFAYGHLFLYETDEDMDKAAVITPIKIEISIEIPIQAQGMFLGVVKDFNWGPDVLMAEFNQYQPVCLKQE